LFRYELLSVQEEKKGGGKGRNDKQENKQKIDVNYYDYDSVWEISHKRNKKKKKKSSVVKSLTASSIFGRRDKFLLPLRLL
jgi:hypothetical protein